MTPIRMTGTLTELHICADGYGVAQIDIGQDGHHNALIITGIPQAQCDAIELAALMDGIVSVTIERTDMTAIYRIQEAA